jgi:hypothetical protein
MQLQKTFTDSKVVSAIEYQPEKKVMLVTFTTQKKFAYMNVSADHWQQALTVESIGSFINNVIKKEYFVKDLNK